MSKNQEELESIDSQPESDSNSSSLSNSRRDVLKKTATAGTLGVFGLSGVSGTAAAYHEFHTEGPNKTTADGGITIELASSTYESKSDDLVPFGVVWNIDQDCGSTAWHEVRNLTLDFYPFTSNPTVGSYHTHNSWDDDSDQNTYPDEIEILTDIAWELAPSSWSLIETGDYDRMYWKTTDNSGGDGLQATWGEEMRCS